MEDWGANEEIFAAASDGDVARLEDLVSRGAKVDAQVRGASTLAVRNAIAPAFFMSQIVTLGL